MTCDSVATLVFGRKTRFKRLYNKYLRAEHLIPKLAFIRGCGTTEVGGLVTPVLPSQRPCRRSLTLRPTCGLASLLARSRGNHTGAWRDPFPRSAPRGTR